jgi:type IV secretion system protein VirB1
MQISILSALALAAQCAPSVAPETLLSVVQVESGFSPLAIGVNGRDRTKIIAATTAEAASKASALIAAGRSVDLGLAQINSRNLGWLGLSVADAFDPCRNLTAAAQVLRASYFQNDAERLGVQPALQSALSRYNSGSATRGVQNGYFAKVQRAAAAIVPAIQVAGPSAPVPAPPTETQGHGRMAPPTWDVFGQSAAGARFVLHVVTPSEGDTQ